VSGTLLDEVKNRAADLMANENMPWETAVAQARDRSAAAVVSPAFHIRPIYPVV
jgi:hypothetical protein